MRLVLLGPPGSGKGTQGPHLAERLSVPLASTGEILRDHARQGTPLGLRAESYMSTGELVPDSVIIDIMRDRVSEADAAAGFILDGVPRTVPQAEALDRVLEELGKPLDRVIYLKVSPEVLEQRLGDRWTCPCCGRVFSGSEPRSTGVCDDDGVELLQREDDRPEAVKRRLQVYLEETMAVLDFYRSQSKVLEVDGERSVDEIREDLERKLDGPVAAA